MDCIEGMKKLDDKSIDMILCDLPYGTTACKWDTIIPFKPLWEQYKRIIKYNGTIVLTASQPFTSALVMSNIKMFKYSLVWWKKGTNAGFAQAPYKFLKVHEDIVIFSYGGTSKNATIRMTYNPQGLKDCSVLIKGRTESSHRVGRRKQENYYQKKTCYPKSILIFNEDKQWLHPTQKPLSLFEYFIKTYSNEGEIVLDNCIGSGTTAVACKQLNRRFIGFEIIQEYVNAANKRLMNTIRYPSLDDWKI